MKIEAGKRYVTRAGRITGPLIVAEGGYSSEFVFESPGFESETKRAPAWRANGHFGYPDEPDTPDDLVSEYVEHPAVGDTYETADAWTQASVDALAERHAKLREEILMTIRART